MPPGRRRYKKGKEGEILRCARDDMRVGLRTHAQNRRVGHPLFRQSKNRCRLEGGATKRAKKERFFAALGMTCGWGFGPTRRTGVWGTHCSISPKTDAAWKAALQKRQR